MSTRYVVWVSIEKCEGDPDDYDSIESVGEPRQAGRFRTEQSAYRHLERLLRQTRVARKTQESRAALKA